MFLYVWHSLDIRLSAKTLPGFSRSAFIQIPEPTGIRENLSIFNFLVIFSCELAPGKHLIIYVLEDHAPHVRSELWQKTQALQRNYEGPQLALHV